MSRTYETIYDTENEFDWTSIASIYIDGVLTIEQKTLDTGFGERTWYRDGYVSSFQQLDSAENVYDWSALSTSFNAEGDITAKYISYDDGRYVQMNISDGEVTSESITFPDTGAANALIRLSTFYADGEVVRKFGTYANGSRYQDEFTNGVRDTRYRTDYTTDDSDGVKPWELIAIEYDTSTGDITERNTYFDNGEVRLETFVDGVRATTDRQDVDDAYGWSSIQIAYDNEGVMTFLETTFDNGVLQSETFDDGQRVLTVRQDLDDAKVWDTRETRFEDGQLAEKGVQFDKGDVSVTLYTDGVRATTDHQDLDDAYGWNNIQTTYDSEGAMTFLATTFDNGVLQSETFDDGQRVLTVELDLDDKYGWSSIQTAYDSEGAVTFLATTFDNGVLQSETFDDGQRVQTVRQDLDDAKVWDTRETRFEDGQISEKRVGFDNGDALVTLYTDGVRSQTLQFDGDDSADWLLQVIDYPLDGESEVTLYTSVDDIPADLLAYLPDIQPPVERTEYVLDFNDNVRLNDGGTLFDETFVVDLSKGKYDIFGILIPYEYGGTTPDADLEAFNSWGATVGFSRADDEGFDFASLSLANSSRSDTTYIPETNWANTVTINGYNDGVVVQSVEIDLTFDHVTHDLNWEGIDHIEFVASGGTITNDYVENAGWLSMDDLVFIA